MAKVIGSQVYQRMILSVVKIRTWQQMDAYLAPSMAKSFAWAHDNGGYTMFRWDYTEVGK